MEDYTSNSKKSREQKPEPKEKTVEKVVTGDVTVKKQGLGKKFKNLFVEADLRSVTSYVISDVLIPAARNMIVESASQGVERLMYGDTSRARRHIHRGNGSRVTMYNSPINRGPRDIGPSRRPPMESRVRRSQTDIILASRDEAELVLERLNDIIDNYEVASVADLNELVGLPTTYTDNNFGWVYVADTQVRQTREGYLLDLPPAEPIK